MFLGEVLVGVEVVVFGSLEVDGFGKVEFFDNDIGVEVEVVVDDFDEFIRVFF